jgi:outer membrane protein insertion porin family
MVNIPAYNSYDGNSLNERPGTSAQVRRHRLRTRSVVPWLLLTKVVVLTGCVTGPAASPYATTPSTAPVTNRGSAQPSKTPETPSEQVPISANRPVVRGQDAWSPGTGTNPYANPAPSTTGPSLRLDDSTLSSPNAGQVITQPSSSNSVVANQPPVSGTAASASNSGNNGWLTSPFLNGSSVNNTPSIGELPGTPLPVTVRVQEDRTGRFMFGAGVNSDAGVTGQIIVDERNFDIFGFPTSWDDVWNGEAFRGRGQGFRLEAVPGNQVQRYLVSFTEPYLFHSRISLNTSGFLYDRGYFDWTESRAGGRLGLGYRLTPDLSASGAIRAEGIRIKDPRVLGVAALDDVVGNNSLYSGRFSLRHDTRDMPFSPTEGHLIELSFEQAFGDFDYPRGEVDIRRYFLIRERADGSGRHTIAVSLGAGFSGADTPLFENYFAGGFSTIRGFEFRGASPVESGVIVGGRFRMLGSLEYKMPVTADDMIKAVAFCDFGTVERDIDIVSDNFRVAPGFGFRINVPALGPAPLAFDFAFPIAKAVTDDTQVFSFFFGLERG